jgi:AhpD family alkylhydroperoxidase
MSTGPRILPGDRHEIGLVATGFSRLAGRVMRTGPPNIFTTLSRHRGLFLPWLLFAGRLMPRGRLPRADTELVILRVAHRCGCEYEWRHHERIAQQVGLSADEVARVRQEGYDGFSARQMLLLRAVDELHDTRTISDQTWAGLRPLMSDVQLIELCMLAGHYEMLAMTLNALRVEVDH